MVRETHPTVIFLVLGVSWEHERLVPKLRLGNALVAQALLGRLGNNFVVTVWPAKQSFAPSWVPKPELGDQA
jgi:hypothetical protein